MAEQTTTAPDRLTFRERLKSTFSGWFNPGTPIQATAPPGTPARQFDYSQAYNLNWMPRPYDPIPFAQLRLFADNCYLMRVVIEKMKDRICSKSWHFRLKPAPGEYVSQTKERSNKDPRIAQLTQFYQFPDSVHSWKKWVRMILEDRLVIDAASLEVQRNKAGGIINFLPINGATISLTVDETGRTPMPPLTAYRQVIKGLPSVDFSYGLPVDNQGQLLYMIGNPRTHKLYGYSPVEQTVQLMLLFIYKTVFHLDMWSESDLPFAQIPIPDTMSVTEAMRLMREIQARLSGNLAERSKMLPVFGNGKIELIKKDPFDVKFEEWAARVFCYIVGEPATGFVQQNNRATAQQADDTREESGEQPLMGWVKDEIDAMVQRPDVLNATDIEFVWDEEAETDALKQAQVDEINVQIGQRTADENRQRDGLSPIWEESNGNPPWVGMAAVDPQADGEETDDDPGKGKDKPKPKPKPKPGGKKTVAKASQKKTLKIDPGMFTEVRRSATDAIDATLKAFFFVQRHAVSKVIDPYLVAKKAAGDGPDPDKVLNEVDWSAWDQLQPSVQDQLEKVTRDAVASVFATLGLEQSGSFFDLADKFALEYAQTRAAELVGKKWVDGVLVDNPNAKWAITETTREELRDLIGKAFAETWTPAELAQQIDSAWMFSAGRAEMIAETETSMALTAATVHTGTEAGATTKSVQMSNLHDVDDECDAAEQAGEVPIESTYPDGSLHVPLHPRCRCVELLHFAETI
jgi:hypothetical protein